MPNDAQHGKFIVAKLKICTTRFYAVCEACRPAAFALNGDATAHRPSAIVI